MCIVQCIANKLYLFVDGCSKFIAFDLYVELMCCMGKCVKINNCYYFQWYGSKINGVTYMQVVALVL